MKKYYKKALAVVLTAVMTTGVLWAYMPKQTVALADVNDAKTQMMTNILSKAAGSTTGDDIGKEETVYVITDAEGNEKETIDSVWLKNTEGVTELTDMSTLNDIENVKGYEEFTKKGDSLTWHTEGNDIYYQGTPKDEVPVGVSVSYKLDGKAINPKELKGKSGHVEITYTYSNKSSVDISVSGNEEESKIPFVMLTGLLLPADTFTNISVDNGKVLSEGNNDIVIGYGMPGMQEALKLDELKDSIENEEIREEIEDVNIPASVTIEADATDFELGSALTIALPDVMDNIDISANLDTETVREDMNELTDGVQQLSDGSEELTDGIGSLKDGTKSLNKGAGELKDGTTELKDGTGKLKDGAVKLRDGSTTLAEGTGTVNQGAGDLENGASKVNEGAKTIRDGLQAADEGAKKLETDSPDVVRALGAASTIVAAANSSAADIQSAGQTLAALQASAGSDEVRSLIGSAQQYISSTSDNSARQIIGELLKMIDSTQSSLTSVGGDLTSYQTKMTAPEIAQAAATLQEIQAKGKDPQDLITGISDLRKGLDQLYAGSAELADGTGSLKDGAAKLHEGTDKLKSGADELCNGAGSLYDGTVDLDDGAKELDDGAGKLYDGSKELDDGAGKLFDGSHELSDGITKLNDEGVAKISDAFGENVENTIDRVKAIKKAGKDYDSFSGKKSDTTGSVKFIIKTGEI